jgi:polyphosphate kinase
MDDRIKQELKDILNIQLEDNVKARLLNNDLTNEYVRSDNEQSVRSQTETYLYLQNKTLANVEISSY